MATATDFRLSVGFFEHPKTLKLERRIGDSGVLSFVRLLRFATLNRPDGSLIGMSNEDIAIASGYKGDEDTFVQALTDVRYLDKTDAGIVIHDWADHNPWVAGADARSEQASNAAKRKWELERQRKAEQEAKKAQPNAHGNAKSDTEQCSEHESAVLLAPLSTAPILSFPILSDSLPILSLPEEKREREDARDFPPSVDTSFTPPSQAEVLVRLGEIEQTGEVALRIAKQFMAYYTDRKWTSGKDRVPITDWRSKLDLWMTREPQFAPPPRKPVKQPAPPEGESALVAMTKQRLAHSQALSQHTPPPGNAQQTPLSGSAALKRILPPQNGEGKDNDG